MRRMTRKKGDEEMVGQVDGDGLRPFILPLIWTVNNFNLTMSANVFNKLREHFQIPENIPIRLPRKLKKCYLRKTVNVGMYDAMFAAGLRLPLMELHRQLSNYLVLSVSQIAPNAWRIFLGAEVIWGQLNGGNRHLTLNEFFYCYKPQQIFSLKDIYHFLAKKDVAQAGVRHGRFKQELEEQIFVYSSDELGVQTQGVGQYARWV